MYLYDVDCRIKKYQNIEEIQQDFYDFRLNTYVIRKEIQIKILQHELDILALRIRFIRDCIADIIVFKKNKTNLTKNQVMEQIENLKYPKMNISIPTKDATPDMLNYDYLTNIKIWDLTTDHLDKLQEEHDKKLEILEMYKNTTVQDMWNNELTEFEKSYKKWLLDKIDEDEQENGNKPTGKNTTRKTPTKTVKAR